MKYQKQLIVLVISSILLITGCSSNYRFSIIVEIPNDQEYKVRIISNNYWLINEIKKTNIEQKQYRGLSKILEDHKIGNGLIKINLNKILQKQPLIFELIGQTNDRRIEITSEQFKMYKATDTDIIFYLTGIDK